MMLMRVSWSVSCLRILSVSRNAQLHCTAGSSGTTGARATEFSNLFYHRWLLRACCAVLARTRNEYEHGHPARAPRLACRLAIGAGQGAGAQHRAGSSDGSQQVQHADRRRGDGHRHPALGAQDCMPPAGHRPMATPSEAATQCDGRWFSECSGA